MAIPACGLLLADMGAEVIKVEPPSGDAFRVNQTAIVPGESKGFTVLNRGKRSVCIDLTRPESRRPLEALLRSADVALLSLKPSDLPRYRLTYAEIAALNPSIVFLEHVPLGPKGPFGSDGGYDVVVQGMSGTGAITARSNGDAPSNIRPAYIDMGTGFLSALAVVAALRHRDLTGEGQRVETSLLSTALALGNNLINWFAATDPPLWERFADELSAARDEGADYERQRGIYERTLLAGAYGNIYFRHYRTKDGFISVGCLSPALNARFRKVTGLDDPREQPGFDRDAPGARDSLSALIQGAEDLFRTRTTTEWIAALKAGGVPCGPFNFPPEVFSDPQVLANDFVVEIDHPTLGPYKTFASPIRMDRTPVRPQGSSPILDADTDCVLGALGLDPVELADLRALGVIGSGRSGRRAETG
jgi:formyl-CoA transferase